MGWAGSGWTGISCRAKASSTTTLLSLCVLAATSAAEELPASAFNTQQSRAPSNMSGSILLVIPGGWDLAEPPNSLAQAIADMVQVQRKAVVLRSIELLPGRLGSAEVLVNFTLTMQSIAMATRARAALRNARLGEALRELKADIRMACFHNALGHCEMGTEPRIEMPASQTTSTIDAASIRHSRKNASLSLARRKTGRRSAFLAVSAMAMAVVMLLAAIVMVVSSFLKRGAKAHREALPEVDKDDGSSDQYLHQPRLSVVCLLHA
eukprot:TRINITY_DN62823_c0_g1_i1.p1 TRINITY_DN62823_c0_g1~~TRINITY_DN62823_c0_g1_i1.p1  ORF type:complete len:266 (-),score=44.08 TRINITY_DN62823_c0_g1_i1:138-935(-)